MSNNLLTHPITLLRLEGGALLALALVGYAHTGGNWLLFAVLLLAPDLSALGYVAGPRFGAACYNLAHTTVIPLALVAVGLLLPSTLALILALIWCSHIGMDRLFAYGLKYPDAFKDTHLTHDLLAKMS